MTASKQLKTMSVRLPAAQLRRFKAGAAARGQSLQTVVTEAVEAWLSRPAQSADEKDAAFWSLRGCLAGTDVWEQRRQDKLDEWEHDRRLAELGSSRR